MGAFMDLRCDACRRRFGFRDRDEDAPRSVTCPHCGRDVDVASLRAELDEARAAILEARGDDDAN